MRVNGKVVVSLASSSGKFWEEPFWVVWCEFPREVTISDMHEDEDRTYQYIQFQQV